MLGLKPRLSRSCGTIYMPWKTGAPRQVRHSIDFIQNARSHYKTQPDSPARLPQLAHSL